MRRKFWALLMTIMMIATLVPASAFAEKGTPDNESLYEVENPEPIQPSETGGLYLDKQLSELDENGEGTITLETYVEGSVSSKTAPMDIILVLDQSGSMEEEITVDQDTYELYEASNKVYYENRDSLYVKVDGEYIKLNITRNGLIYKTYTYSYGDKTITSRGSYNHPEGIEIYKRYSSQSKLDILKSAVKTFVANVESKNETITDETKKHRIAIAGFASESGNGNNTEILTVSGTNSGSVGVAYEDLKGETGVEYYQKALVNADNNIVDDAIDALAANGATRTDLGLEMAENILKNNQVDGRKQVVIMFTDGEPTMSIDFNTNVANATIASVKKIKAPSSEEGYEASVYTIGLYNKDFDKAKYSNINKFMNFTSSNYPDAANMNTYINAGAWGGKYYNVAKDASSLESIFQTISEDVQSIDLDEDTIIKDVVSQYFTVNGETGDIKAFVSKYDGKDNKGIASFGEKTEAEGVTATINNDTVSVSGFDFEPVIDNDDGSAKSGKKLTIVIPVKLNKEATVGMSGEKVDSNNNGDNVAAIVNNGEIVKAFNTPQVQLPKEKIVITAASAEKVYDGTALTDNGFTYTQNVLKEGDILTAVVEGSQTDAGESENVVTSYKVMRGDNDVTANYDISTKKGKLKVTPREIIITVNNEEKYFGELDPEFTGSITGNLVKEDDLGTITYSRTNDEEAVGTYEDVITANYTGNNNYSVEVVPGDFTIKTATDADAKLEASGGTWEYDGNPHAASAAVTGAEGYTIYYKVGDRDWTTKAPSVTDVAEGTVTVSVKATKTGYTDLTSKDVTLAITPRPITITVNNAEKSYGEDDPAFKGSITTGALVNTDDLGTITYSRTNDEEAIGTYEDVITGYYTENDNYSVEVVPGDFTIKTASIEGAAVIAEGGSWTYDGKAHAARAEVTGAEGYTIYYKAGESGEWTTDVPSVTNVAEGTVTVNVKAVREGYEDLEAGPVTIRITPKDVIITSEDAEKVYDGKPLESKEITSEGFVEGEGITGEAVGSQTNVGSSENSIEYAFNNNTQEENYNVTKNEGVLTVTHAVLTVTADDKTKVQGTDNPELTGTINGFVNGEDESVISGNAEYATTAKKNSAVGEYPIIVSEGTLTADNYIFEYVEGTLTITEKDGTEVVNGGDNGDKDKNDNGVKTGDNFNMWIYVGLALVAAMAALVAVLTRKQRQR